MRIFRATRVDREGKVRYSATFARWLPSQKVTPLGDQYLGEDLSQQSLGRLALSGRFVAYTLIRYGRYNGEGPSLTVMRLDVRAGRLEEVRGSRIGGEGPQTLTTECDGGLEEGSPGITDLDVTPDGTVVWMIGRLPVQRYLPDLRKIATYGVCELPRGSRTPRLLASGASVEPRSLATDAGYVYWTEDGQPQRAPLR